jgi:hypothetical protein
LRDFLCLRSERIFRWGVSEANETDRFDAMTAATWVCLRRLSLGCPQNGVCRAGVGVWRRLWGVGVEHVSARLIAALLRSDSGLVLAWLSCLVVCPRQVEGS